MSVAFKELKLYFKIVVIGAVVLVIGLTLFKNRGNVATVWFFKSYEQVNVLRLMLLTALGAIISFWVLTASIRLIKEYRGVKKQSVDSKRKQQLEQRVKELEEREQRIDHKVQQALSDPGPDDDPVNQEPPAAPSPPA